MTPRIIIIGTGNPLRGDDAAGLVVAEMLADRSRRCEVDAQEYTVLDAELVWDVLTGDEPADLVILIDAAEPNDALPSGSWRRLTFPQDHAALATTNVGDTHTLNLDTILSLSRVLKKPMPRIWLYAIGGLQFGIGCGLSDEVQRAVREVAAWIESDLRAWRAMEETPCMNSP